MRSFLWPEVALESSVCLLRLFCVVPPPLNRPIEIIRFHLEKWAADSNGREWSRLISLEICTNGRLNCCCCCKSIATYAGPVLDVLHVHVWVCAKHGKYIACSPLNAQQTNTYDADADGGDLMLFSTTLLLWWRLGARKKASETIPRRNPFLCAREHTFSAYYDYCCCRGCCMLFGTDNVRSENE